jgi:tetratricopeptide (TPR) repeat protein
MELGRYDEAIAARQRSLDIRRALLGEGNASFGVDLSRLARVYAHKGEYAAADSLFQVALANQARYVPETHPNVRGIYAVMAERFRLAGKRDEAERYARLAQPR